MSGNADDWTRYLGDQITPEEYGGCEATLRQDLQNLWGDATRVRPQDHMTPQQIRTVAKRLARLLPHLPGS